MAKNSQNSEESCIKIVYSKIQIKNWRILAGED